MSKTYREVMAEARQSVPEWTPDEVRQRTSNGGGYTVLDVREKEEYREGHLPGSVSVPRGFLDMRIEETVPDKNAPIILYCAGGTRSLLAGRTLKELGYTNLVSMQGGFSAWKNAGLPWKADRQFTPDQLNRYSRHFLLPEVGEAGQAKLLDSKVLCIGAGGLGSPTAFYLAAAGVGTIGIVDMDTVDVSNLQRQILHTNDRVGMPKVESAKKTLNALNPDIKVIGYQERVSSENIMELIRGYDVIVDGCDNFPTRYLVNDACVIADKPNVHGSIFQFDGQATVFAPHKGPCYRCLFPEPPPPGAAPSCAEAGVLGVLPGIVGSIQALEAIKILLDLGDPLIGRLLAYDALEESFRSFKVRRDPACPTCGEDAPPIVIAEYDDLCLPHATLADGTTTGH